MSRQVQQTWDYTVWATNEEEAGRRALDGCWIEEVKGDSCSKDDDPQIGGVEEDEA